MADETLTLTLLAKDLASGNIGKFVGNLDRLTKRGGLVGAMAQGVGQSFGQMLNPIGLVTKGIGMVTDAIGDAVRASAEEERNIAKMGAALMANIPAWDGNTAAIERVVAERERLAFSDDDLRQSMALLVPATKDVNEALRLQAIAMDLSRLRGTELAETSTLIAKVSQGNLSSLKRFGITLDKNATAAEALATIQKMAAGQAEAYGKTTAGALEAMDIAVSDLQEDIGKFLTPSVKKLAEQFKNLLSGLPLATGRLGEVEAKWRKMAEAEDAAKAAIAGVTTEIQHGDKSWLGLIAVAEHLNDLGAAFGQTGHSWANALQDLGDQALLTGDDLDLFVQLGIEAGQTFDQIRQELIGQVAADAGQMSIAAAEFSAPFPEEVGLSADRAKAIMAGVPDSIADELKSGRAAIRAASENLKWAIAHPQAEARRMVRLSAQLMAKDLLHNLQSKNPEIRAAAVKKREIIEEELRRLRNNAFIFGVETADNLLSGFGQGVGGGGTWDFHDPTFRLRKKPKRRASGGPAWANEPVIVGDGGRAELFVPDQDGTIIDHVPAELFVPDQDGTIIDHVPAAGRGGRGGLGGSSVSLTVNFHSLTVPGPAEGQRLAQAIMAPLEAEMRRRRILIP